MTTAINSFIQNFSALEDTDYGDFMRKANRLLIELDEEVYAFVPEHLQNLLDDMKTDIQFYPNWDIESTRRRVLRTAETIRETLSQAPHTFPDTKASHLKIIDN